MGYNHKGKNNPMFGKSKFGKILTLNFLIENYIKKSKSTITLAKEIGCSDGTVRNALIKYNIERKRNNKIKIICNYCNKIFEIYKSMFKRSAHHFCSMRCAYKWNRGENSYLYGIQKFGKENSNCGNGDKIKGKNNPFYGKHHTKLSKKKIGLKAKGRKSFLGKHHTEETKKKISKIRIKLGLSKGKRNGRYTHGLAYEPYSIKFTEQLKESVRQRDNYICQNCGVKEKNYYRKLDIHHIDYNKQNCKKNNLITLCSNCNALANANRDYWYVFYNYLMETNYGKL